MTDLPEYEETLQINIAIRAVLGLLRMQSDHPGAIEMADLPHYLLMAADERQRHGDYGAERMLCEWADMLRDWKD